MALYESIWPPNHAFSQVTIVGITHPRGLPVDVTVTGITQDEPLDGTGEGRTCPDGMIVDGQARVRMERSGFGNGRVYRITFVASDVEGGS